ncbi:MAG: hypothetical protein E6G91_01620 [Alphaproteobacteria bacterium]|nr:MAG: hypothetical protein E6G91_01620 [Alphaproteobacteria bacterium]
MASALRLPAMTEKLPASRWGRPIMCFLSAGEKDAEALYSFCAGQRTKKSDLGYPPTDAAMGGFRRRVT